MLKNLQLLTNMSANMPFESSILITKQQQTLESHFAIEAMEIFLN